MLCTVKRDKKRRNLAKKEEIKRIHAKTVLQDLQLKNSLVRETNHIQKIDCFSPSKVEFLAKANPNWTIDKNNIFAIVVDKTQKQDFIIKKKGIGLLSENIAQRENKEDFLKSEIFKKQKISLLSFLYKKASKNITRNSSKSRIKNRCIETGRAKSILRDSRLSRIMFRERASKGLVPGICKTSW